MIFRAAIPVLATSPAQCIGFKAVPVIDGTLSSEITLPKLRSVRAYTSPGVGDCFQTRQELRAAIGAYLGDGADSTLNETYGWPIGTWCVTQVQDFGKFLSGHPDF
jgi:hypothetical protein